MTKMKYSHVYTAIAFLILALSVSAQTTDKTVEAIRAYYDRVSEQARLAEADDERGVTGGIVMNELVINKRDHQWRAVGIYGAKYKFFYKGGDSEKSLYPDQLVKVVVERTVSNRSYTEQYLFSDNGLLMFYFQKSEGDDLDPDERRVYFYATKAVRIVEDGKLRDRLTAKDAAAVREIDARSKRIKDLFLRSIKL